MRSGDRRDQDVHSPHHCSTYTHGKGLEQPGTSDKHSESIHAHHQMTLHLRVLIAAATRHPAQPEGLGTNPNRLAEGWYLPREARGRLARSVEACMYTNRLPTGRSNLTPGSPF